jgi:hypothetical protein
MSGSPVIDIHEHAVPRRGFVPPARKEGATTAAELVAIMDKQRIDRMVVLPLSSPEVNLVFQSVEEAFEACDQYPGRFIKFCNVDPRLGGNALNSDFVPILEYYKSLGAKGVGEVVANLWWHDPRVQNLLRDCEKAGLPFLFHLAVREFNCYGLISSPGLSDLEKALQQYPKLQFIAHSMPWWSEVGPHPTTTEREGYPSGPVQPGGRVPELMRRYKNLWGDLSAGSGFNAVNRDREWGYRFIEEFQDRLLMGHDVCVPSNDACPLMGFLREALDAKRISQRAYQKVMGQNAAELLQL